MTTKKVLGIAAFLMEMAELVFFKCGERVVIDFKQTGTSVIGTSKTTRIVVLFPKHQEDSLGVLKRELAHSFGISPLQCSLRLQLQSGEG